MNSLSNEEKLKRFIEKSNIIYNNKYDYSLSVYVDNYTPLIIRCPEHDNFKQTPKQHKKGGGCKKCKNNHNSSLKRKSLEQFIEESNKIHNNFYDYSLAEYVNNKTKLKIICPIHDIFEQTPHQHVILKQECRFCMIDNYKKLKEDFIEQANIKHNNKYDYSLVEYVNNKTKIKIICPVHGVFGQRPDNHLTSNGCKLCGDIIKRIKSITRIEENKLNGYQLCPNFNKEACKVFDEIMINENIFIQHAMNGGEYYIKELGYWVDGYDKENNVVYEFDEEHHFDKHGNLKEKDKIRQKEIEYFLKCTFIRIKK